MSTNAILKTAGSLRASLGSPIHDEVVADIYDDAAALARVTIRSTGKRYEWDRKIDKILTSRVWGFPIMLGILMVVFLLTIQGAKYPYPKLAQGRFWVVDQIA
jgi:ferrous iron transport protein B